MDNLIIEKIWQENDLIELQVIATSEFITARQTCYIQHKKLIEIASGIEKYIIHPQKECYLEFGNKVGNYTPAFSLRILNISKTGHLKIEVDLEIADIDTRTHRSVFFIETNLGSVERFGKNLNHLYEKQVGYEINLNK